MSESAGRHDWGMNGTWDERDGGRGDERDIRDEEDGGCDRGSSVMMRSCLRIWKVSLLFPHATGSFRSARVAIDC